MSNLSMRRRAPLPILVLTVLFGCGESSGRSAAGPIALSPADTLVTTSSELIGGVYDLALSPAGDLYVVDYGFKHVLMVGPNGEVRDTIGSEGSGPGEFRLPYIVGAEADTVRVFDTMSNLVQVFDRMGALARSYRVDAPEVGGSRAFGAGGRMAGTIGGFDSALVMVIDATGARVANFGEPIVPPTTFYDFGAIKADIREDRVPDAFRNQAFIAWGPGGSVYLAFLAEPEVRRYDAEGRLLWSTRLDEPVLTTTRERFVQKNIAEQNPSRIYSLRYVTDLAAVYGDLWLLLNTEDEEEGLLLVLDDEDGTIRGRLTFPGLPNTGQFVVDEVHHRLYMAPRQEASILIFELPTPIRN